MIPALSLGRSIRVIVKNGAGKRHSPENKKKPDRGFDLTGRKEGM